MEGDALKAGKARVRAHLIWPLAKGGMVRKRGVSKAEENEQLFEKKEKEKEKKKKKKKKKSVYFCVRVWISKKQSSFGTTLVFFKEIFRSFPFRSSVARLLR